MRRVRAPILLAFAVTIPLLASDRLPVIVALRPTPSRLSAQEAVLAALEADTFEVTARWNHVRAFAADVDPSALARLRSDPLVERVDVDSGGSGGLKESIPLIGADVVHAAGYYGVGVRVAVLDSGIDESHPDFAGKIADEQCFCRNADGSGCCPNGQTSQSGAGAAKDDHGHGTNVTGILASRGVVSAAGVASGASIVAVKVLDRNNRFASTAQVVSALDWLVDHHPEVRVVNMSLYTNTLFSSYCDSSASFAIAFADVIRTLRSHGTLVFACSGNEGSSTQVGAPACIQDALSVGAVYDSNIGFFGGSTCSTTMATADQIACFSNSNATLDLLAPGVWITSDGIGGTLSTYAGTSQATPHAAGAAAVLMAMDPALTADDVDRLLKSSGRMILDSRNGVSTPRVDLLAAALRLRPTANGPKHRAARH